MATRNLTTKYNHLRSEFKNDTIIDMLHNNNVFSIPQNINKISENVNNNINLIKQSILKLKKLYQLNTNITTFSGNKTNNNKKEIEYEVNLIKQLFSDCLENVKKMYIKGVNNEIANLVNNMKSKLVTELNNLNMEFNGIQRDYVKNIGIIQQKKKDMNVDYQNDGLISEERKQLEDIQDHLYQKGFTDEQIQEVLQNQRDIFRRDEELKNTLQSIVEVQDIFKELNEMVIQQGEVMDRIDENLENADRDVDAGVVDIKKSENTQKCSTLTICLIFVIIFVIGIAIILILMIARKIFLNQ